MYSCSARKLCTCSPSSSSWQTRQLSQLHEKGRPQEPEHIAHSIPICWGITMQSSGWRIMRQSGSSIALVAKGQARTVCIWRCYSAVQGSQPVTSVAAHSMGPVTML